MCTLLSLSCLRRVRTGQLGAGLRLAGACTACLGRGGSLAAAAGLGVTAGSLLLVVLAGGGGLAAAVDFEKQVHRLLEAVAAKRRRIRELKTDFEQRSTRSSDVVTFQGEECGRLQELVDHLQEKLQKASKQLKRVTSRRDHAAV
ncbi:hypothetical protein JG688_00007037 [Phytophthora aleatoria]|uniref:Uncharacterized protein n=1 Tax=Phytophthora aleatoria TaxID=2496075 RepID=A0A8J5IPX3_9STRA|nr:hypothetical protein JG688_00007037 [Phytophthora aleatoria]